MYQNLENQISLLFLHFSLKTILRIQLDFIDILTFIKSKVEAKGLEAWRVMKLCAPVLASCKLPSRLSLWLDVDCNLGGDATRAHL
jgi:hypothetical protein